MAVCIGYNNGKLFGFDRYSEFKIMDLVYNTVASADFGKLSQGAGNRSFRFMAYDPGNSLRYYSGIRSVAVIMTSYE